MSATPKPLLSDLDLLRRLIAFDSTSHRSNLPIADFIADYLDRPGVHVERNPSKDGDKTNLVVRVGPEVDPSTCGGLTLSGHVDVVPALEPEWRCDPFDMQVEDDRLVGRGTCDMKGFVALAVNAAARAAERSATLSSPVALVITYDEELGTLGARRFVDTWPIADRPLPRRTIVGEPTSLRAVRMHKGHAKGRLELRGAPAHSGYPHLGKNAIEPMGRAIVALSEVRRQLEEEGGPNSEHFPEVPFVALNLARIHGGAAINIIPERCVLDIGFRLLPGMDLGMVERRIEEALGRALEGEDYTFEPVNHSPPMLLDARSDLYGAVCLLADQTETVSASYATDAGWMQEIGFECLLYGPGDISVAHRPNEWLPRDEFERCAQDLDALVERFCG
ncbi:MAG: acetylornithine deacetylase [Acidobacteriota bacterium]